MEGLPDEAHPIATQRLKWSRPYQKKYGDPVGRGARPARAGRPPGPGPRQADLPHARPQRLRAHRLPPRRQPGDVRARGQPQSRDRVRRGAGRVGGEGRSVLRGAPPADPEPRAPLAPRRLRAEDVTVVRPERAYDAPAIRRVHEEAFGRAAEADLVDALRSHGTATLSLVADRGGRVVGHLLFSPVRIESGHESTAGLGLGPMAVLPAHQREGNRVPARSDRTRGVPRRGAWMRRGAGPSRVLPAIRLRPGESARARRGASGAGRGLHGPRASRRRPSQGAASCATRRSSGRSERRCPGRASRPAGGGGASPCGAWYARAAARIVFSLQARPTN